MYLVYPHRDVYETFVLTVTLVLSVFRPILHTGLMLTHLTYDFVFMVRFVSPSTYIMIVKLSDVFLLGNSGPRTPVGPVVSL